MSSVYVAFLRGVNNIGATTRVSMADLRALFESLGFRDVRTLLNSGTVVFSVPAKKAHEVKARIENGLATRLGVTPSVTLLSGAEVVALLRANPLAGLAKDPSRMLVVVLQEPAHRRRLTPLLKERWAPEVLALGRRVAYLWCARGVAASDLWPKVDRALERTGTARNLRTMTKLAALVQSGSRE